MKLAKDVSLDASTIWGGISKKIQIKEEYKLILIVHNQFKMRVYVNKILNCNKYELHHAIDATTAISYAKSIRPDLIITGFNMQDNKDAIEICKQIRLDENLLDTKIIVISSLKKIEDRIDTLLAGANDYVINPFSPLILTSKVARLLDYDYAYA